MATIVLPSTGKKLFEISVFYLDHFQWLPSKLWKLLRTKPIPQLQRFCWLKKEELRIKKTFLTVFIKTKYIKLGPVYPHQKLSWFFPQDWCWRSCSSSSLTSGWLLMMRRFWALHTPPQYCQDDPGPCVHLFCDLDHHLCVQLFCCQDNHHDYQLFCQIFPDDWS